MVKKHFFLFLQGSSTSDCMSKTLDSASAHFAASAVVSAPAPGRSEGTKEQNTSHNNINGVVQPSGEQPSGILLWDVLRVSAALKYQLIFLLSSKMLINNHNNNKKIKYQIS